MKKEVVLLIGLAFLVICAIVFVYSKTDFIVNSSPSDLEECKSLVINSNDGINLVFLSDKETAEDYTNYLFSNDPFSSYDENFNVYYIDSFKPECDLYRGEAILCYSRENIRKASSCPSDYVIVPIREDKNIRSSSYVNFISINTNHPKSVLLHEIGHAMANLAEEYVPATIPSGSKNCDNSCDSFSNSCFEGCSRSNYFRSIDSGVMRTLNSEDYGEFNKDLIIQKIIHKKTAAITGNAVLSDCSSESYYLATILPEGDGFTISNFDEIQGCYPGTGADNYYYSYNINDAEIISGFNSELIFTDSPGEEEIIGETYDSDVPFYLPFETVSDDVTFYNSEEEIINEWSADNNLFCRI